MLIEGTDFGYRSRGVAHVKNLSQIVEEGQVLVLDDSEPAVNGVPFAKVAEGNQGEQFVGVSYYYPRRPDLLRGVTKVEKTPTGEAGDAAADVVFKTGAGGAIVASSIRVFETNANGVPTGHPINDVEHGATARTGWYIGHADLIFTAWESGKVYAQYDVVVSGGRIYVAKAATDSNDTTPPAGDTTNWEDPNIDPNNIPAWDNTQAYNEYGVAQYQGQVFVATSDARTVGEPPLAENTGDANVNWEFEQSTGIITLNGSDVATNNLKADTHYSAMYSYSPTMKELELLIGDRPINQSPNQYDGGASDSGGANDGGYGSGYTLTHGVGIAILKKGPISFTNFVPGAYKVGDRIRTAAGGLIAPASIVEYDNQGTYGNVLEGFKVTKPPTNDQQYITIDKD